jgi:hypothetical protein
MLRMIALTGLACVAIASGSTCAQAQWSRALGTLLRSVEEAFLSLREVPKRAPEETLGVLPKADVSPAEPTVASPRSQPAPLSTAQASARSFLRCVDSGDPKSQECNKRIGAHLRTSFDSDGLGLSQSGVLEDGVLFSSNGRLTSSGFYSAYSFGTPPNVVQVFCVGSH